MVPHHCSWSKSVTQQRNKIEGGLKLPDLILLTNNVMFGVVLLTSTWSPTATSQGKYGGDGRTESQLTKYTSCGLQN